MLRNSAHKLVKQLGSQTSRSSAIFTAVHSSSSDACHVGIRVGGDTSTCVPSWSTTRRNGWREYLSGSSRRFRASGELQLGTPEPIRAAPILSDIVADDLVINRSQHLKAKPMLDADTLKFGAEYTDHMLQITWTEEYGWSAPSIDMFGPMLMHPCAQVLHYGMVGFEGMKAFKDKNGEIRLFRPELNMNRFARSAARLALPAFDKEALLDCIKALLCVERDWIPDKEGFSLYIRPTIISTHPHLGVGPPRSAIIFCVLSPVGPYFPEGLKPIKLLVEKKHVRAFPGGIGDIKVGGNYAPTVLPQMKAVERGCSQVLYVLDDGLDGGAIGESGTMNVFFLLKKGGGKVELITPHLNGLILPGVTRDSVLALTRSFGDIQVSEKRLSWDEIDEAGKNGNILEVFGTGTACMIQPIIGLLDDNREISIPFDEKAASHWIQKPVGKAFEQPKEDEPVSLIGRLTRAILDIQYGHTNSDWSVPIDSSSKFQ